MEPKMKLFVSFIFLSLMLALSVLGCSVQDKFSRVRWSRASQQNLTPELATLISSPHKSQSEKVEFSGYKIEHWRTMIGGFPVEGSWIKVLRDSSGAPKLIEGDVPTDPLSEIDTKKAQQLVSQKEKVLSLAWQMYPELREAKKIFPSQIVLKSSLTGYEPFVELSYLLHNESDVVQAQISQKGRIIERRSLTNHLITGSAQVFPGSPFRTPLAEVILSNLVGDGTLTSSLLKVESEGGSRAFNLDHQFRFQPDESAFDEVQAYYFVEQALVWLKSQYSLSLPFQLKVKVHVGGVVPSNAAFYFSGNIYLGDGDNVIYKKIPQDPSIVIHEVGHSIVQILAGLPNDKEGGSLNEGFADFIAALFLDSPRMAEYSYLKAPFRRNLENSLNYKTDAKGSLYHDSTIVSGTLWEIRQFLGKELTGRLALQCLGRLGAGSLLKDFPAALQGAVEDISLDDKSAGQIKAVLIRRGWVW
jgi:Zn-dependent metalloprotease